MRRLAFIFALTLLAASHLFAATTRYVTTSGSDSNPCTLASPCATPDHAANTASPGDTVLVGAGTYDYGTGALNITNSGTAGNYITVTCVTPGACKIQSGTTGNTTISAIQANFIIFDGFEVVSTAYQNTPTYIGNNIGIYITGSFVKVTRNFVHHINIDCSSSGGGGIESTGGTHDILFDSNLIWDIGWPDGGSSRCNNTVVQFDGIIPETNGANIVITNNIIYHVSGGWGIGAGGQPGQSNAPIIVANNTVFSNADGGIVLAYTIDSSTVTNNIVINNGLIRSGCGIDTHLQSGGSVDNSVLESHNDLFGNTAGDFCSAGTPIQTGNINIDPSLNTTFVNWQANGYFAGGDYHQKAGSPTIGGGVVTGAPNHDVSTNPRPSASGYDIGAYEFGTGLLSITLLPPANGYNLTTNVATAQLTPKCTYIGGFPAPDNCAASGILLVWGVNDPSQISVNFSGLVTGANGPVCVTPEAYAYSGQIIGHHQVLIDCSPITSIVSRPGPFSGVSSSRVVVGTTILLSAVDNNNNGVGDYVAWTTSDATKATVNNIGEVVGVAAGSTTITATIAGQSVGRTINVTNPTVSLTTYYVRPGGGTRWSAAVPTGQCNGTVDVDYPGSGTNQNCAVNEIMGCLTDESSPTIYTGLVQAGGTCFVHPGKVYTIGNKDFSTAWISASGGLGMPSGTPANPTKLIAACSPSCTTDPDNAGNRVLVNTFGSGNANVLFETQNVIMEGFDITSGEDCNHGLTGGQMDFECPTGHSAFWVLSDDFTSNIQFKAMRVHGYNTSWIGTPGPGVVFTNFSAEMGYLAGLDFDNGFGENGNRTDGFIATGLAANYNGCTECQPKTLTSVSRDGSGHLNVAFAAGQIVNYVMGTNIVLAGNTPSDLNGTFPVSAITFNQQTVTITATTCTEVSTGSFPDRCVFTTTTTPTFGVGAFVNLAGSFSPAINAGISGYEVFSVGTNTFSIIASQIPRPNWPASPTPVTVTCSGTCTASTANALVATQTGSAESASVVGTASFVHPAHRCYDQGDLGANGDGVGTGNNTINIWSCDQCQFLDNMQDGWDMLHSVMTRSILTNSIGVGNEGAPAKLGNADVVTMYNDILLATCSVLMAFDANKPPDFNQYLALPCRANASFGLYSRAWSQMTLSNLTWGPGNQNGIWDDNCSDAIGCGPGQALPMASYVAQNSAYFGFNDTNNPGWDGSIPFIYLADHGTTFPAWTWNNNAGFNVRNPPTGGSGNSWALGSCPIITCIPDITTFANEVQALIWNVNITTGSAMYHAGIVNAFTPATDFNGASRGGLSSIGALEPLGAPTLVSIAVTPNPGAVNVSATLAMTCTSTFSDSTTAPCTAPAWTDTNTHSSINSSTGVVTGVSAGADTVTATISSISGNATVNVSALPVVATPTASPVAGTYTSTQSVTLSTTTGGATICYTVDGTTPAAATAGTCSHGTTYTGAITVAVTTTIKALGTLSGDTNSAVATFAYTISPLVATPAAAPPAGTYAGTQSVVLSDATAGATICFTNDGTTPTAPTAGTCSGGTTQTYTGAITVAATSTIKAIGTKAGNTNSSVATFAYTILPPLPSLGNIFGNAVLFGNSSHIP